MPDITPVDGFRIEKNNGEKYWLKICHQLVEKTGWPYSIYDYEINSKSFDCKMYFTVENSTDTPVGLVSLTNVLLIDGRRLSIFGTFYVQPEYRKLLLGWWLFNEMLKNASDDQYLTASSLMWRNYRDRLGFTTIADNECHNFSVTVGKSLALDRLRVVVEKNGALDAQVINWRDADYARVCDYDARVSRCDRSNYLARTFAHPGSVARVVVRPDGSVAGISRVRIIINENIDLGPIYADDEKIAALLLLDCMSAFLQEFESHLNTNSKLYYTAPSTNTSAKRLFALMFDGDYEPAVNKVMFTREILMISTHLIYSYSEAISVTTA